jgi:hypothetical protein
MSSLADLARQAGQRDEALDWLRRAHEASRGHATRFQWGAAYLLGLLDLAPGDETRIREESLRVLRELLAEEDAFDGRNQLRLKRLEQGFAKWNGEGVHAAALAGIREELGPSCSTLEARERCEHFFESLGS